MKNKGHLSNIVVMSCIFLGLVTLSIFWGMGAEPVKNILVSVLGFVCIVIGLFQIVYGIIKKNGYYISFSAVLFAIAIVLLLINFTSLQWYVITVLALSAIFAVLIIKACVSGSVGAYTADNDVKEYKNYREREEKDN